MNEVEVNSKIVASQKKKGGRKESNRIQTSGKGSEQKDWTSTLGNHQMAVKMP